MSTHRWVVCPGCDTVQVVTESWVDDGGEQLCNCYKCQQPGYDVPFQIIVDLWRCESNE